MKKLVLILFSLVCFTPGISLAIAPTQNIHIEWSYNHEPIEGQTLAGYHLYQEGTQVCTSNTPSETVMDCSFESEDGTFDFTLTAFSTNNNESPHSLPYTFSLINSVEPELVAAFATTPLTLSGDTPFTVSFDATGSTGDVATYAWDFGDSSSGSGSQTSHTYDTAGTFTALLTVTSSNGSTSQKNVTVNVAQAPIAAIATDPTTLTGDLPFAVSFDATGSTGDIANYTWDFGDNSSGSGSQTSHTYNTAGTFTALLTVTSSNGSTSQKNVTVSVVQAPIAAIATDPTTLTGDAPFAVSFDATGSTGDIATYAWDFGDSSSGSGSQTSHTYNTTGTFTALLTVTSSNGSTSQKNVTVNVVQAPIAAIATDPTTLTGDLPFAVSFDATGSTGDIANYTWDFGDSSSGSGSQTSHTYNTAGTFTALLTVTSSNGSTSQKNVTVNVVQAPIAAIATDPTTLTGDVPFAVSFDATGSTGDISSYAWDFGDSSSGSGSQTSHTYDTAGTFTALLTVTSSNGSTSQKDITFIATAPAAPPEAYDIHLEWSYDYQPIDGRTLAGYYLYKEGVKVCTNNTPDDRAMDCSFESQPGTFDFTITAFCSDGYESPHSTPYPFTLSDITNPESAATFTTIPTTLTGDVPFTVAFDGTSSPGAVSYKWVFGDGDIATDNPTEHTFTAAGTFTSTLTVTDSEGHTNSKSVTVTVTEAPSENTTPIAVIGSSTAMGDAPLSISFDGTGSSDAEGPIISYFWNFGDGSPTATGNTASHSYTIAGTYYASLTVTDNQGATNTTSTPIIVTGQAVENQAPTAIISASITEGSAPLAVSFDGSTSTDPENAPLTYNWNFGDGSTTQGATATHTYTISGSFTATLTVTDNMGATASATTTINSDTPLQFKIELGEVEIDNNWVRVAIEEQFTQPIIVAGPPSSNDSGQCVIRLRNIDTTGFDIRIQEWDYQDGTHAKETIAYLILEKGSFTLPDGTMVEAGQFDSPDTEFKSVSFNKTFHSEPIVMTSISTFNEEDAVTGRLKTITTTSFEHKTQEQELSLNGHLSETVNYIAWEPSRNNMGSFGTIVNKTGDKVRNRWYTITYEEQLSNLPIFLGTMQSQDETETAAIRYTNKTTSEIQVMIEEEQSEDDETRHSSETVGYFLFFPNSTP